MLARLIVLLTVVPIAELFVMLSVHRVLSEQLGWARALGISVGSILVTGIVGALLARRQGIAAVDELRAALARGEFPGRQVVDAVLIAVGGALLLTPGYLTDALGLTLLIPATRTLYRGALQRWWRGKVERGEASVWSPIGPAPGEAVPRRPSPPSGGQVIIEESFAPKPGSPGGNGSASDPPRS